ncbi:MAG TPA: PAS domain S-box protein, partial [Syntrophorhabdales bacterium]|nr:PAS domain S-box protein [Syntrophorhabdales bacterium]
MTQKRILAVEDNDIFASFLEAALTDLGYAVLQAATSGEEAIARAKAQKPDLILMDIELAGEMNGIATADRIQSFLAVPIIYLTSHSGSSVLEQARATAPYGYLVKPVSRQDLSAAIEMALNRHALDVRLKESESRLKMALASAHMGVWEWDGETNEMFGSPESHEILGLQGTSGTFESFAKLLHPEDAAAVRAAVEQISIDHPLFQSEFRFIRPDGEVRWLASSGQGYFDDTGALVRMIGTVQDITERRTVEENLRASRLQLAEAADMAKIAYWELDETKGEFTLNDAFYNLYGTTAEQEGGYRMPREKYGRTFIHPDDRKELQRQIAANRGALPRADKLERYEHRGLRKDGEVIHIVTRNRIITDSEGHALKTVGVNQDITARKKMEDALRESETKLRAILEGSRDAIAVLKDERHIFVNPAYVSLFGYGSADELIGRPASELIAPESRGLAEEMASKRAPDDPAPSLVELTALRKDGTTFLMESSVSVYALKGEQFALVILRDITEKKRLEEQLSQAQKMEAVG